MSLCLKSQTPQVLIKYLHPSILETKRRVGEIHVNLNLAGAEPGDFDFHHEMTSTSLLPASPCNTDSQQLNPAEIKSIISAQIHQHSEILSHSLHCNVSPINPDGEMTQPGSDTVLYHRVPRHLCGLLQSMQQGFSMLSCKYCDGKRQGQCQAFIRLVGIS